jgi:hypothetical protein
MSKHQRQRFNMAPHTPQFLGSVLLLALSAGTVTAANSQLVSAATLFTSPASPIVDLGYGKFQGKDDSVTGTHNYLGKISTLNLPPTQTLLLTSSPVAQVCLLPMRLALSSPPSSLDHYPDMCRTLQIMDRPALSTNLPLFSRKVQSPVLA